MNNKKGFTLIEMLVVVGMIGVLAAAVLTALGPLRQKARDARIISGINQIAALAETSYDGTSYKDITSNASYTTLKNDITSMGGDAQYSASGVLFRAYSKLASDANTYYCVDSNGTKIQITSIPSGNLCK